MKLCWGTASVQVAGLGQDGGIIRHVTMLAGGRRDLLLGNWRALTGVADNHLPRPFRSNHAAIPNCSG